MIVALGRATGEEHKIDSDPLDFLRHGFGADPLFEAMIAERDSETVGLCLFFYTFSTWLGEPGIYVQDIIVSESERGTGLGKKLLAETARYGRDRDATHLRLTVDVENDNARCFYERIGMEHHHRENTYHIGREAFRKLAGERE